MIQARECTERAQFTGRITSWDVWRQSHSRRHSWTPYALNLSFTFSAIDQFARAGYDDGWFARYSHANIA